jgi:hypothetical protein
VAALAVGGFLASLPGTGVENWDGGAAEFRPADARTHVVLRSVPGAGDGRALALTLPGRPAAGPGGGTEVASVRSDYRYGTYATRLRAASCPGQPGAGVVTGAFTYSPEHGDGNGNGLADNDEIDIEFHCARPDVVWLTLWTDYDEARGAVRKVSRVVDLRTGTVLSTCASTILDGACLPPGAGEGEPPVVRAVPGFDATAAFRTYGFEWRPDRVTFFTVAGGRRTVLWDYRGPRARIPGNPSAFRQNVWFSPTWDPAAPDQPAAATTAYVDSTTLPR